MSSTEIAKSTWSIAIVWTARNSAGASRGSGAVPVCPWALVQVEEMVFYSVHNPAPSTSNTTQSSTPHHLWHSTIMNTITYSMERHMWAASSTIATIVNIANTAIATIDFLPASFFSGYRVFSSYIGWSGEPLTWWLDEVNNQGNIKCFKHWNWKLFIVECQH